MKGLYIDCSMGVAGDMLMSALADLLPNPHKFIEEMNALNIPQVSFELEKKKSCGVVGSHIKVLVEGAEEHEHCHNHSHHHHAEHHHAHHHATYGGVSHVIDHMAISDKVKHAAKDVYRIIAEAEGEVHGEPMENIHFHEVGTLDAIADVVGCCLLMELIAPEIVYTSEIHVGSGTVQCAHGVLPVPAPATAKILKGIPIYGGEIKSELCTPTGAALIKYFTNKFGAMPKMTIEKDGYGIGTKEFNRANCVRVLQGEITV